MVNREHSPEMLSLYYLDQSGIYGRTPSRRILVSFLLDAHVLPLTRGSQDHPLIKHSRPEACQNSFDNTLDVTWYDGAPQAHDIAYLFPTTSQRRPNTPRPLTFYWRDSSS